MKKRYSSILLGLTLSLLYIIADVAGLLPPAEKDAFASFGFRSLFVDGTGKTRADWLNADKKDFSCNFASNEFGYYCGIDIRVGDGREHGEDLSNFTHVRLKFNLQGDGKHIRINIRNAFDDISVVPEGKQQDTLQPIDEGFNEFFLPIDSFTVPYYWLDRHPDIDQSYLNHERDNVTHMGFFFEEPAGAGTHVFRLEEFSVVNIWISILSLIAYILFPLALMALVATLAIQYVKSRPQASPAGPKSIGDIRSDCEEFLRAHFHEYHAYDSRTRLLSRKATIALLEQHAANYALSDMAILAVSLDKHEQVRSELGEQAMWEYQASAALVVRSCVGTRGVACYWSESQYLVLLPHAVASSAKQVAKGIRYFAAAQTFSERKLALCLSVRVTSISALSDIDKAFKPSTKKTGLRGLRA